MDKKRFWIYWSIFYKIPIHINQRYITRELRSQNFRNHIVLKTNIIHQIIINRRSDRFSFDSIFTFYLNNIIQSFIIFNQQVSSYIQIIHHKNWLIDDSFTTSNCIHSTVRIKRISYRKVTIIAGKKHIFYILSKPSHIHIAIEFFLNSCMDIFTVYMPSSIFGTLKKFFN